MFIGEKLFVETNKYPGLQVKEIKFETIYAVLNKHIFFDKMGNSGDSNLKECTLDDMVIEYTLIEYVVLCEGAIFTHLYDRGQLDNVPFDSKGEILAPFIVTIPMSLGSSGYPAKDIYMKDVREKLPKLLEERNGWNCSIVDNNTLMVTPNIYFRKPWAYIKP